MHVTPFNDAQPYSAPLHADAASLRLQGAEASACGFCVVGLSHYLPGGRAEMSAGTTEKIYVVLEGLLTVEVEGGEVATLGRLDSCLIPAGERREVRNETNSVVTMLVVVATAGS